MTLTLGFSPCPNDTFIFDALVNKKIDTGGIDVKAVLEDVETLNQWTLQGKLDITKLSFPAFFQSTDHYTLLNAGSALGKGVGPLLVAKKGFQQKNRKEVAINDQTIALPGINTTAHLLFSYVYPEAQQKKFMIFSAIEESVANGETELGVIIHENRFTYQQKGLEKVMDLGEYWEERKKVPIPLGGIAIKKSIDPAIARQVDQLIRKSLEYSFANYPLITDYVKQHSQAMDDKVMRQHIDLYVNNYSLDLGIDGKEAIKTLYNVFATVRNKQGAAPADLFVS
jgi:1,4-dihydroxy-6-naphthoate synthase